MTKSDTSSNTISRKERFDALKEIANFHLQRVQSRNNTEWRIAFSAWALIVAAIAVVEKRPSEFTLITLLIFFCVILILMLAAIYRQNAYQATRAYHYIEFAESVLNGLQFKKTAPKSWHKLTWKEKNTLSPIFTGNVVLTQTGITICLGLACYFLIGLVHADAKLSTMPTSQSAGSISYVNCVPGSTKLR